MALSVEKMQAQLELWSLKIDKLAESTLKDGVEVGFDVHMHIDELKALRAIAQSTLIELKAGGAGKQTRLRAKMRSACDDLDTALKKRMPLAPPKLD